MYRIVRYVDIYEFLQRKFNPREINDTISFDIIFRKITGSLQLDHGRLFVFL